MPTPIQSGALSAPSTVSANTYSDPNGLAALKKDPNSPQALHAVAQQVDALFLQMMLKSMRDASAATGAADSNEMGLYQDLFDKQIALTLSQHQSLGLGSLLTRQIPVKSAAGAAAAGSTPATDAGKTAGSVPVAPATDSGKSGGSAPAAPMYADKPARPAASKAAVAPPTSMLQDASDFIDQVLPTIKVAAQALGVNPLGLLAQAALETGWGRRMARTADGVPSLNLFGIKADQNWTGARAGASTVEYAGGVATQHHAAFRAYDSIEASVHDFASLLKSSPRYHQAMAAGGDAQAYVNGIGQSGYATDPRYTVKLNEILHSGTLRTALSLKSTKL